MDLVTDLAAVLGLILLIGGVVTLVYKFWKWNDDKLENKIVETIQDATAQIQIDANGGQSLNDLHKKINEFMNYQKILNAERGKNLETLLDNQTQMMDDIAYLRESVIDLEEEVDI